MTVNGIGYQLIETDQQLRQFAAKNKGIEWMGFDTEFVGERRFHTLLCLIQVSSPNGYYIIDPFSVRDLGPFLRMMEDEKILKFTHAGENDYKLLYSIYGIIPKNIFDTQVAAGFAGYRYPISFKGLVEGELGISLKKGYAMTNWEQRPMSAKQIEYALNDVTPLYKLWQSLTKKLKDNNRYDWAMDEISIFEDKSYYQQDPDKEALSSNMMNSLKYKERLFLLRLLRWRIEQAMEKNYSKEMVLPNKQISQIVRSVSSGERGISGNRHISPRFAKKYAAFFYQLYSRKSTREEDAILQKIKREDVLTQEEEVLIEFLYLLVKYRCIEEDISSSLVIAKSGIKKLPTDKEFAAKFAASKWKREFLGESLFKWLQAPHKLRIIVKDSTIEIVER